MSEKSDDDDLIEDDKNANSHSLFFKPIHPPSSHFDVPKLHPKICQSQIPQSNFIEDKKM
jgi:hypothetical protein